MITEATTTKDLIATTLSNTRALSEVSFEEGCTVLDAIELFDHRTEGGKLGTWLDYNRAGRNALRFIPEGDPQGHQLVCEKLTRDIFTWTSRQCDLAKLMPGDLFTAWVVIDRATHVTWVECSPVKNTHAQHPRTLREAGEFPSSSRGTVSSYVFLRMGEPWRQVENSTLDAYHAAKDLLDHHAGCDRRWNQDADATAKDLVVVEAGCNHIWDQDVDAARKLLLLAKDGPTTGPHVDGDIK